jgi:F0F1-type ATP synthase delta subunit
MKESRHHLAQVIGEKTLHVTDSKLLAREIAAYLLNEKQTSNLESLIRDIIAYRADHGAIEAIAASTSPLSTTVLEDIRQMLQSEYPEAQSIVVREKRDDSVIGGVRIDLPNEQLDLTVKSKLSTFKRLTALERNKA